jgi:uncharacterized protein (TIGR02186 family)
MAFWHGDARADDLVSGLSQDQIEITSNYTGTDLVIFGAVELHGGQTPNAQPDVVVVVRGPDTDMTVRRKERVAGIWINRHEVTLKGMPGFYYLASARAMDKIAALSLQARYQLGTQYLQPTGYSVRTADEAKPYIAAAIRQEMREGLYKDVPAGIEFLSYSLFRVRVPVPANVPRGQYTAEVYLFRDGNVISAQSTPFFVDQTGMERQLYSFAHSSPLLYGLTTVLMALTLGWTSSLIFRRR